MKKAKPVDASTHASHNRGTIAVDYNIRRDTRQTIPAISEVIDACKDVGAILCQVDNHLNAWVFIGVVYSHNQLGDITTGNLLCDCGEITCNQGKGKTHYEKELNDLHRLLLVSLTITPLVNYYTMNLIKK